MDFEEQVKAVKDKCRTNANNRGFRLTKDEMDILILSFQAGDQDAGQCFYDYMEHYMNKIIFGAGESILKGKNKAEFLMNCQEVFYKCMQKYDCDREERFEAYLSKSIINECVNFKKNMHREIERAGVVFESDFSTHENSSGKHLDLSKMRSIFDVDHEISLEDEAMKPEIMRLLDKLGTDHKRVIVEHIFNGKSYSQIAKEEGKDKSTIRLRYSKAIRELKMLIERGHQEVADNEDSINYRMIKSYRTWKAELAKREGKIDFEKELIPYLSEEYKYIFEHVITNYDNETLDSITKKLNKNNRYVTKAITLIFNKMDTIIYQKQTIKEFYERYGGVEGKKDLESFLSDDLKIVLNEYMLSINPEAATYVKTTYPGRFPQDMYKYVMQILNTFDNIMERKKNCESFIARYGGYNYLKYVFGPMLTEDHFKVLTDTMMDYHYSTLTEYSASLGRTRSYANMAQERILEKLYYLKGIKAVPNKPMAESQPPKSSHNGE